jgi:hypothetical protein
MKQGYTHTHTHTHIHKQDFKMTSMLILIPVFLNKCVNKRTQHYYIMQRRHEAKIDIT